jgi:hypothetical protein
MVGESTLGGFGSQRNSRQIEPGLGAGLCGPAILLIGVFPLQELIGSNDTETLHLLVDGYKQILEERCNFVVADFMVTCDVRDLCAKIADPVIEPASGHIGEGACIKNAGMS